MVVTSGCAAFDGVGAEGREGVPGFEEDSVVIRAARDAAKSRSIASNSRAVSRAFRTFNDVDEGEEVNVSIGWMVRVEGERTGVTVTEDPDVDPDEDDDIGRSGAGVRVADVGRICESGRSTGYVFIEPDASVPKEAELLVRVLPRLLANWASFDCFAGWVGGGVGGVGVGVDENASTGGDCFLVGFGGTGGGTAEDCESGISGIVSRGGTGSLGGWGGVDAVLEREDAIDGAGSYMDRRWTADPDGETGMRFGSRGDDSGLER